MCTAILSCTGKLEDDMANLADTGISISAVAAALGVGSTDLGTLCAHDNVNEYSEARPGYWFVNAQKFLEFKKPNSSETDPRTNKPFLYSLGDFRMYNHEAFGVRFQWGALYSGRSVTVCGSDQSTSLTFGVQGSPALSLKNPAFAPAKNDIPLYDSYCIVAETWNAVSGQFEYSILARKLIVDFNYTDLQGYFGDIVNIYAENIPQNSKIYFGISNGGTFIAKINLTPYYFSSTPTTAHPENPDLVTAVSAVNMDFSGVVSKFASMIATIDATTFDPQAQGGEDVDVLDVFYDKNSIGQEDSVNKLNLIFKVRRLDTNSIEYLGFVVKHSTSEVVYQHPSGNQIQIATNAIILKIQHALTENIEYITASDYLSNGVNLFGGDESILLQNRENTYIYNVLDYYLTNSTAYKFVWLQQYQE